MELKAIDPFQIIDPKSSEFYQHQETMLGCGRFALNNLLGGAYFIKDDRIPITDELYRNLDVMSVPISLKSICNYFLTFDQHIVDIEKPSRIPCPEEENYLDEIITFALQTLGYYVSTVVNEQSRNQINEKHESITGVDPKDKSIKYDGLSANEPNDDNVLGYIANIGKYHWICFRKTNYKNPETEETLYLMINSSRPSGRTKNVELINFSDIYNNRNRYGIVRLHKVHFGYNVVDNGYTCGQQKVIDIKSETLEGVLRRSIKTEITSEQKIRINHYILNFRIGDMTEDEVKINFASEFNIPMSNFEYFRPARTIFSKKK